MSVIRQIAEYLYLKKKDPEKTETGFIKIMHGINRLSIFLFLMAIIYHIIKTILKSH